MGWTDVSLCLRGPTVQDLRTHFSQRWNFIYDEKYSKKASRYERLDPTRSGAQQGGVYTPPQQRGFDGEGEGQGERGLFGHGQGGDGGFRQKMYSQINEGYHQVEQRYGHHGYQQEQGGQSHAEHSSQGGNSTAQIARSSAKWSHNITTEVNCFLNLTLTILTNQALYPKCLH